MEPNPYKAPEEKRNTAPPRNRIVMGLLGVAVFLLIMFAAEFLIVAVKEFIRWLR